VTRHELIDHCKRIISEAYTDATEMIVAYLETHSDEPRERLCKEIDTENWQALEGRVRRLQQKRRSEGISDPPSTDATLSSRRARSDFKKAPKDVQKEIIAWAVSNPAALNAVVEAVAESDHAVRLINRRADVIGTTRQPERASGPALDDRQSNSRASRSSG
jgi:hypothetical protein